MTPVREEAPGLTAHWFATTHWSVVLTAKGAPSPNADAALEQLCQTYWSPLYAYIRREGYDQAQAQELTQEFLSRLVHREWLNRLESERGKFRSFLLTFLKHFLANQRRLAKAQKRGGELVFIPLDGYADEERDSLAPARGLTPDQAYDKRWARAVMVEAVRKLREEYVARGKTALFDSIQHVHPGEHGERNYASLGAELGMSEQALKSAVHSFRRRHREILRQEIAQTVSNRQELEEEIRHFIQIFSV
jgi:RNA polymerase sigma-70 factor (ECF subfamily)